LVKRFQRRRFLEIDRPETRIAHGGKVCYRIGIKFAIFIDNLSSMVSTTLQFTWPRSVIEEAFKKSTNQKQDKNQAGMFVTEK
jgi:hypothetical protein